jgi:two-component system, response regulator / RNA-binding antiterminator
MNRIVVIAATAADVSLLERGLEVTSQLVAVLDYERCDERLLADTFARVAPDAVVVACASPHEAFVDALFDAMGNSLLPVIVFAHDASPATIDMLVNAGVAAYEIDGLASERVSSIVAVAMARFKLMETMRTELNLAQQKLADRKDIERAKGILMRSRGLSEDDAYHTLRRMAMERNKRLADVARSIIEMSDLLE